MALLPSNVHTYPYISLNVSISEVSQLKFIAYWSGALSFQSILSVLPHLVR